MDAGAAFPALHWPQMPGSQPSRRILFVEDEAAIFEPFSKALRRNGFEPVVARTVAEALESAERVDPDLVLLDLNLPDGDGSDVCRSLRRDSDVPIVMLTARGTEMDRVLGLELGADDYVVKPFSSRELISRIRAVLRRPRKDDRPEPSSIIVGDLEIDPGARSVRSPVSRWLWRARSSTCSRSSPGTPGQVVTREDLMSRVWDVNWFGSTKTLDVHIKTLRRKLGDDSANPRFIETVRGVGFRLIAARTVPSKPPAPTHARGGLRAAALPDRLRRAARRQPWKARGLRGPGPGQEPGRGRGRERPRAHRALADRHAAAAGDPIGRGTARSGARGRRAPAGSSPTAAAPARSVPTTPPGPRSPLRSAARAHRRSGTAPP